MLLIGADTGIPIVGHHCNIILINKIVSNSQFTNGYTKNKTTNNE